MISKCCSANALFGLTGPHGIYLKEDGDYSGVCSNCREQADFVPEPPDHDDYEFKKDVD